LAATNIYQMPIPVLLPPQEHLLTATTTVTPTSIMSEMIPPVTCTTRGLEFFGNNIVATFGAMTSLQVPPEALANIQNNNNMSTVTNTCFVSNPNTSNVNAQDGGVTLHYPCAHQISFQLSSPSPLTNSGAHISTGIAELKHRRQDFAHIKNTSHVYGVNGATNTIDQKSNISVDDGQK
jgi:nuclear transcription factor Y, gamma